MVGDAGILVDPNNAVDISNAVKNILVDFDLRELLVKIGLQRIQDFDWDKCAKKPSNI